MKPDLTTFGKVIGGGLPIGAVGGHQTIMETLSPLGPVFHAGTLAGNPIATAAGLAALNLLKPEVYMSLSSGRANFLRYSTTPASQPGCPHISHVSERLSVRILAKVAQFAISTMQPQPMKLLTHDFSTPC